MSTLEWRFPSNNYGESKGFRDSGVETFRGTPLKSLAREVCQNSLDAAYSSPVRVEFNLFETNTDNIPGKKQLEDAFGLCKEFWSKQNSTTINDAYNLAMADIKKETCYIMRISDFNTTGLTGTQENLNSDWTNLTKSSGVSDKKATDGGSFGIGKFAPFACSNFFSIFYSTLNKDNEEAFQGVSRLVTFRRSTDGQTTQGVGYYGHEKNRPAKEQLALDPGFKRGGGEFGTDIYIVGYKYANEEWEEDIVLSILSGFLSSIWDGKLEVKIGKKTIKKDTLRSVIAEYSDNIKTRENNLTKQYFSVLTSQATKWESVTLLEKEDIKIGLLVGEPEASNKVAMIRQTGMKIMDQARFPGQVPFCGVMLINGDKLNSKLRNMENPEHTKWEPDRLLNKRQGQEIIKSLHKCIKDFLERLIEENPDNVLDAVGIGQYIPDQDEDSDEPGGKKDDVTPDKLVHVQAEKKKARSIGKERQVDSLFEDEDAQTEDDTGGGEEDWTHKGEREKEKKARDSDKYKPDPDEPNPGRKSVPVGIQKHSFICTNKNNGEHVFKLTPNAGTENGEIDIFLSTESDLQKAKVLSAYIIGNDKPLSVRRNKIKNIPFEKGKQLIMKLRLDVSEYCSMEVKANAIEE